jgi:hypothetical protein
MGISSNKNYKHDHEIKDHLISKSSEQKKIFQQQMKKSICKIKCKEGGNGTGFLCLIPFPSKLKELPVLITSNQVLSEKNIEKKTNYRIFNG